MIICRPRFTALIASVRCSSCSLSLSVSHFVSTHWVLRCVEQLVQRRPEDERSTVGTFSSAELLALPWHQYDYGFRKCGRILIGHSQLHLPAPVDTRLVKIVFPFCLIRVPFTFFLPPHVSSGRRFSPPGGRLFREMKEGIRCFCLPSDRMKMLQK